MSNTTNNSKILITFLISATLLIGSYYRKTVFDLKLNEVAVKLIENRKTDEEKIASMINYCYNLKTTSIRNYNYGEINNLFTGKKKILACYYKTIPVNLIPSYYVARYGLTYSGPCGAKSKLLLSLLESAGYSCRLAEVLSSGYMPIHSIVEVKQNNIWTPTDPTLNLYFADSNGKFIETSKLNTNLALYNKKISEMLLVNGVQNSADYNYSNVKQMTFFHYAHSLLKASKAVGSSARASESLHLLLLKYFSKDLIHYQIGVPGIYTDPVTIPIYLFSLLSISSLFFFKKKTRSKVGSLQKVKLKESSLTCVE